MRFLADENISNKVVNALKSKGIDIVPIRELTSSLSDETVLKTANIQNRILITFDADFGELVFRQKLKTRGVILLRFTPKSSQHTFETIANLLETQAKIRRSFYHSKRKKNSCSSLKIICQVG